MEESNGTQCSSQKAQTSQKRCFVVAVKGNEGRIVQQKGFEKSFCDFFFLLLNFCDINSINHQTMNYSRNKTKYNEKLDMVTVGTNSARGFRYWLALMSACLISLIFPSPLLWAAPLFVTPADTPQ